MQKAEKDKTLLCVVCPKRCPKFVILPRLLPTRMPDAYLAKANGTQKAVASLERRVLTSHVILTSPKFGTSGRF
jgi:hypothetical protein